jgi:hypothetical protein
MVQTNVGEAADNKDPPNARNSTVPAAASDNDHVQYLNPKLNEHVSSAANDLSLNPQLTYQVPADSTPNPNLKPDEDEPWPADEKLTFTLDEDDFTVIDTSNPQKAPNTTPTMDTVTVDDKGVSLVNGEVSVNDKGVSFVNEEVMVNEKGISLVNQEVSPISKHTEVVPEGEDVKITFDLGESDFLVKNPMEESSKPDSNSKIDEEISVTGSSPVEVNKASMVAEVEGSTPNPNFKPDEESLSKSGVEDTTPNLNLKPDEEVPWPADEHTTIILDEDDISVAWE